MRLRQARKIVKVYEDWWASDGTYHITHNLSKSNRIIRKHSAFEKTLNLIDLIWIDRNGISTGEWIKNRQTSLTEQQKKTFCDRWPKLRKYILGSRNLKIEKKWNNQHDELRRGFNLPFYPDELYWNLEYYSDRWCTYKVGHIDRYYEEFKCHK